MVADPIVPVVLDTQRILVTTNGDEPAGTDDAQWADSIPKLVQAKIIESFEKAGFSRIGRPTDGITADYQLLVEVRRFPGFAAGKDRGRCAEHEAGWGRRQYFGRKGDRNECTNG